MRARVCHPNTRTYVRLLGPCFKTGLWQGFRPRKRQQSPIQNMMGASGYHVFEKTLPPARPSTTPRIDGNSEGRTGYEAFRKKHTQKMRPPDTPCNSFPFSDFRHSLTLFSKFFASFPHGTCSLSVSRQYLALEGIYLPLRAAVPSNSTLRKNGVRAEHEATNGTVTLHGSLFQGNWTSPTLPRLLETTIRALTAGFSD